MSRRVKFLGLCTALGVFVAAGSSAAVAAPSANGVGKAATSSPQMAGALPAGYKIVHTGTISAPNGHETFGQVNCPRTSSGVAREPQSGGVVITSSSLFANVNSSYPSGASWNVDVNNNSGADTTFVVYAVCATPRHNYQQVVSASFPNSAGSQNEGFQQCPTGTKVLGGGALELSSDLAANLNTTIPTSNGWRTDLNNGSGSSTSFTVRPVCSAYSAKQHYGVHLGTAVDNPPGTETFAEALCPSGQSSLGGGVFSNSGSTSVNINSSWPLPGAWANDENNASGADASITPYVICAT